MSLAHWRENSLREKNTRKIDEIEDQKARTKAKTIAERNRIEILTHEGRMRKEVEISEPIEKQRATKSQNLEEPASIV